MTKHGRVYTTGQAVCSTNMDTDSKTPPAGQGQPVRKSLLGPTPTLIGPCRTLGDPEQMSHAAEMRTFTLAAASAAVGNDAFDAYEIDLRYMRLYICCHRGVAIAKALIALLRELSEHMALAYHFTKLYHVLLREWDVVIELRRVTDAAMCSTYKDRDPAMFAKKVCDLLFNDKRVGGHVWAAHTTTYKYIQRVLNEGGVPESTETRTALDVIQECGYSMHDVYNWSRAIAEEHFPPDLTEKPTTAADKLRLARAWGQAAPLLMRAAPPAFGAPTVVIKYRTTDEMKDERVCEIPNAIGLGCIRQIDSTSFGIMYTDGTMRNNVFDQLLIAQLRGGLGIPAESPLIAGVECVFRRGVRVIEDPVERLP